MSSGYSNDSSKDTLTPYQTFIIIFTTIGTIGLSISSISFLASRRYITEVVKSDGIWMIFIAGCIAWLIFYLMSKLSQMYPRQTMVQFATDLLGGKNHPRLGKWLSVVLMMPLLFLWLLLIASLSRTFGEVVIGASYPNTPIEVIIGSLLLVAKIAANSKPGILARFNELIFPLNLLLFVIIFVASIRVIGIQELMNLFPMFQVDWLTVIKATGIFIFSFIGIEIIYYYGGYYQYPKRSLLPHSIAMVGITFYFMLMYLITMAVFGSKEISQMKWPILEVVKLLEFPIGILERWESLLVAVWTIVVFTAISNLFSAVVGSISNFFEIPDKKSRTISWILVVIIYFLTLTPDHFIDIMQVYPRWIEISFLVIVGLTIILLILGWLQRKKGGASHAPSSS